MDINRPLTMPSARRLVHAGIRIGMRHGLTRGQAAIVVHTAATVARGMSAATGHADLAWLDQIIGQAEVWLPVPPTKARKLNVVHDSGDPGGAAAAADRADSPDPRGAGTPQDRPARVQSAAERWSGGPDDPYSTDWRRLR